MEGFGMKNRTPEEQETLEKILDLMGSFGGFDPETFEEEKQEILDSEIPLDAFKSLVADSMAETMGPRHLVHMPIQKLTETAVLPEYKHEMDACADLYADEDITILAGETEVIGTGLAFAVPEGYVVHIYPRSSTGAKTPLRLSNSVGVIDSGYRDEIKLIFTNTSDTPYEVKRGDRLAQMCIDYSPAILFDVVPDVKEIGEDRGGGIGSTN